MKIYTYHDGYLCEKCAIARRKELDGDLISHPDYVPDFYTNSNTYPQGPLDSRKLELNRPVACDFCEIFLENELNDFGQLFVKNMIDEWPDFCIEQNFDYDTLRANERDTYDWSIFYEIPFHTLKMAREMEAMHVIKHKQ